MTEYITLDQVNSKKEVEVVKVLGGWGIRQRLNKMGVHVGDRVLVKRSGIMKGPILIHLHGLVVAIGHGMAQKVYVREIE